MIHLGLAKIIGLLLFFIGIEILSRCHSLERKAHLKRKIHETMLMVRSNWQARETASRQNSGPVFYGIMGTFMALSGTMVLFIY